MAVRQSEFLAPAVPDQKRVGEWTHERERLFLVKRVERGGPGCAERSQEAAVAELAGVGEDGLFLSN